MQKGALLSKKCSQASSGANESPEQTHLRRSAALFLRENYFSKKYAIFISMLYFYEKVQKVCKNTKFVGKGTPEPLIFLSISIPFHLGAPEVHFLAKSALFHNMHPFSEKPPFWSKSRSRASSSAKRVASNKPFLEVRSMFFIKNKMIFAFCIRSDADSACVVVEKQLSITVRQVCKNIQMPSRN